MHLPYRIVFIALAALISSLSYGQVEVSGAECYGSIIDQISSLESNKDPKCHATASRLEDFMFGTPLSEEARMIRMDLQKDLVRTLWSQASSLIDDSNQKISEKAVIQAADEIIVFSTVGERWFVGNINGEMMEIDRTDFRQYASVAYGLRAILAVQQEVLFDPDIDWKILEETAVNRMKFVVDLASLSALKIADFNARQANQYEVTKENLLSAWKQITKAVKDVPPSSVVLNDYDSLNNDFSMLRQTIDQKLKSYEAYNQIGQAIFLRNIQVYFAKSQWPKDPDHAEQVENLFRESLIYFALDLLHFSERLAKANKEAVITYQSMKRAVDAFLPYKVNKFEDVIYFPLLPRDMQVVIEAYDLDAFRDSGVHWQYVKFALEDPNFKGQLEPDPFAAEMLVEAIAQLGVLIWRKGGEFSKAEGSNYLTPSGMKNGMDDIRELIQKNNGRYGTEDVNREKIVSSEENKPEDAETYFKDITSQTGIDFEHRSADWLSRQIRSYVVKEEEQLARMAIPPAFGGGGVVAEDINHDGWPDVLLLSGAGNRLYLNNKENGFVDMTSTSGIDWRRTDGHYAEPRQPIIADFDNDGHQDIFISYVDDDHKLFKGNGDGTFSDVSSSAGLGGSGLVGGPCTALDYDRDGLLDLYIGYFGNYLKGELPTLARHNTNGTPNKLFKNTGNMTFQDVSKGSGVQNNGWTQAVGHSDINNDGWQDIIVGNDFGKNGYYINLGDGTFEDKSITYGTDKPSYTMNVGIADLNRDQFPDFYISNIVVMTKDDKYVSPNEDTKMHFDGSSLATMRVVEANDLFISRQSEDGLNYENSDLIGRGYSSTGWAWDADFFDYDNDGDEDLYCLNGMNDYSVYGTENVYYMSPEGTAGDVTYAESSKETNVFFENRNGLLENLSEKSGLDLYHTSRSAAYLDFDLDGDLDVVLNNYHGRAYFYENKAERFGNNWLAVQITGSGKNGNTTDAIGAKILISAGDNKNMWREIHSTIGYLSAHPKTAYFGLGKSQTADVKVIWPDGRETIQKTDKVNRLITIRQAN